MLDRFLTKHSLPLSYQEQAKQSFDPVLERLGKILKARTKPIIIGLNGAQGSGKTTLADYLAMRLREQSYNALAISLDDFYYPKQKRAELSQAIHPLLATRGVPGTHDYSLLKSILKQVSEGCYPLRIPLFDKAVDDRVDDASWHIEDRAIDVLILEGWCLGARHCDQISLMSNANDLEEKHDQDGSWRRYVNASIENELEPLYSWIDYWLMLKAPSFDCVFEWRIEQEEKLKKKVLGSVGSEQEFSAVMNRDEIATFIQYFQRVTQGILSDLHSRCDCVWQLDDSRQILSMKMSDRLLSAGDT